MNRQSRFSFVRGFIRGLQSPTDVYRAHSYGVKTTALNSMRSDWERIGADFKTVMTRQHGDKTAKAR